MVEGEDTKGETKDEDRRRGGEQRNGTRKRIRRRRGNSCSTKEATSIPCSVQWKKKLGSGIAPGREGRSV